MLYFLGNTVLLMVFLLTIVVASAAFATEEITPFEISNLRESLEKKISQRLNKNGLTVDGVSLKRTNGDKSYNLSQVENVRMPSKFNIASLNIDNSRNLFNAEIKPEEGEYIIHAEGKFSSVEKVPVLSSNIRKGDIITQNDIELKYISKDSVKNTTIADITKIIGKQAAKNLSAGSTVGFNNIIDPVLIKKNKAVNAIYRNGAIEVRTVVIALEDGKEGDIIKLKNHESGKTFQAIVDKDGSVLTNIERFDELAYSNNY